MASTFHVYMVGLICHIGEDKDTDGKFKKSAAIINEPAHHSAPRICIKAKDLYDEFADVQYRLQLNDEITFSLPGTIAETDGLFRSTIPSLSRITDGGELDKDVKALKKDGDVLGYICYPKGKLTVAKMYQKTYKYVLPPPKGSLDNFPHCIGAIVDFNATTDDPYVTVIVTDVSDPQNPQERRKINVKADGKICIMNDSNHAGARGHHHLDHHRKLTDAPMIARVVETNNDCTIAGIMPDCACPNPNSGEPDPDIGDPECSNSQWP